MLAPPCDAEKNVQVRRPLREIKQYYKNPERQKCGKKGKGRKEIKEGNTELLRKRYFHACFVGWLHPDHQSWLCLYCIVSKKKI